MHVDKRLEVKLRMQGWCDYETLGHMMALHQPHGTTFMVLHEPRDTFLQFHNTKPGPVTAPPFCKGTGGLGERISTESLNTMADFRPR